LPVGPDTNDHADNWGAAQDGASTTARGKRIHSVPAQPYAPEANLRGGSSGSPSFASFHSAPQALAIWPFDLSILDLPTLTPGYQTGKRIFDLSMAIVIAPVIAVLLALIAGIIALTSGMPVFFRQLRIGRHGQQFYIWKFRTMRTDSEPRLAEHLRQDPAAREEWRLTHKLRNDPRVTRFGRFLRKTSLDELPQIFNVLAGTMSFVGPRPIVQAETAKYEDRLPYYLAARPGITGLWQVSGRCSLSYEARVALDESYTLQWTFARDLWILLKTPLAVFSRNGAY
jgi:lipopolysaccharide/colanic/teichoic acid biosynthesis glycosyltransferase